MLISLPLCSYTLTIGEIIDGCSWAESQSHSLLGLDVVTTSHGRKHWFVWFILLFQRHPPRVRFIMYQRGRALKYMGVLNACKLGALYHNNTQKACSCWDCFVWHRKCQVTAMAPLECLKIPRLVQRLQLNDSCYTRYLHVTNIVYTFY